MTINERIKAVRKEKRWSQAHLASILGITQSGVSYMEQNGSTVSDQTIKSLCMAIPGLNESWLRTGTGPMYVQSDSFDLTQYVLDRNGDPLELEIIKAYFALPKEIRQTVLDHFRKCLSSSLSSPAPAPTVDELEAEYKKRNSLSASSSQTSNLSSSTTDVEKAAGDQ